MKTRVCSMMMLVAFVLSLGLSAGAATNSGDASVMWEGSTNCSATLNIVNSTATCISAITAKESTAKITASMVLYRVSSNGSLTRAANWSLSGTGQISASRTYPYAVSGATYRLVVTGTVTDSTGSHPVNAYRQAMCP